MELMSEASADKNGEREPLNGVAQFDKVDLPIMFVTSTCDLKWPVSIKPTKMLSLLGYQIDESQ